VTWTPASTATYIGEAVPIQHDIVALGAEARFGAEERPHIIEQRAPERREFPPCSVGLDHCGRTLGSPLHCHVICATVLLRRRGLAVSPTGLALAPSGVAYAA